MPPPVAPPSAAGDDRLAAVYQLKLHLLGISPQISRRILVASVKSLVQKLSEHLPNGTANR